MCGLKRLFAVLVFLACATCARAQVATVTGNLKNLGVQNVTQQNTYVLFTLYNYGSDIPRVIPTNAIVSANSPPFTPDASGNISGTIQENISITPANTFYRVCVYFQGNIFQCDNYLVNANFNLNTATPLMSVPPPVNPLYGTTLTSICQPTTPPVPDTGNDVLYCLNLDNNYYYEDSTGRVVGPLGAGGGGGGSGTITTGTTGNVPKYTAATTLGDSGIPITNFVTTGTDNSFQNNNRFKGPIPYRDVTAYMPAGGCDNTGASLSSQQGTILTTSTALALNINNTYRNGCGIFVMNAGPASTLATPGQGAASNPVTIGASGAATIHYKVAAIDANYGLSAASAAITATSAPSTRTALNYVGIFWTNVANAVGYLVYTDQTGGGTYVPLGYSYDCAGFSVGTICGAIDKGVETNTWTNGAYQIWPTTPPSGVTNQALITTIVSGGGTTNLVLATPATNSVTNSFTLPDNSMFFKSVISDASTDGGQFDKGTVFVPNGMWFTSTLPFPSGAGSKGVKITLAGQLEVFGLPIMGPLSGGASNTGYVSIEGKGGIYQPNDWSISCSEIWSYPSLGAIFLVSNGSLELKNICITNFQTGIVDAPGSISTDEVSFANVGSGPDVQIDNNSFFSLFQRTNWNTSTFNPVWLLGLTNSAHSSVFDFRDNSFISHGIRSDQVFPSPGYFGNINFTGTNNIEDNLDNGFINVVANSTAILNMTADNLVSGDAMATQYVFYTYDTNGSLPAVNATIHGESQGFAGLFGTAVNATNPTNCRAWTYENSNSGGIGIDSVGYYGSMFGTYTGCDLGITTTGYDVQTTEVLTTGGNDQNGPAGEQIIGHVIRRPRTTLTDAGAGSLGAATYYVKVTMVDVAGRESAPSPEMSLAISASHAITVSSATQIYFPSSCNVYFGTASGAEGNYFNSTSISNGTCTYTLTTTAGETPTPTGYPQPVGNAMRSWLTAENNANSCLFCGAGGGLGSGFLGLNLTSAQYNTPPSGVSFYSNGKWAMAGLATSGSIANSLCTDASGNVIATSSANCFAGGGGGAVSSVFGRTGTVAATNGDYSCSIVTNCPSVPISIANGGTATSGTLTGVMRGGNPMTAAEISGDATTAGSNVITVLKLNGTLLSGLATGLLKITTATGVPSTATSADVIADWTGSCTSVTYLSGSGACSTPAGSLSGMTAGYLPMAATATTITGNSHCDDGITTASTVTCSEAVTSSGAVTAASDGTHAGQLDLIGNTADYAFPTNSFGWLAPSSASFTKWWIRPSATAPANPCIPTLGTLASSISLMTCSTVAEQDSNALANTPTDALILSNTTAATGGATLQYSPAFHWKGAGWNSGGASNSTDCRAYIAPISGATVFGILNFDCSVNGGAYSTVFNIASYGGANSKGAFSSNTYATTTNCAGVGTAASPSVASCGSAAAGHFSCATNATGATCTVNTSAVTANSEIFVFESDTAVTGTALSVTCNTSTNVLPTSRLLASSVAATSFTINLGTVSTNPACFSYHIVN